mmetsp:Transcript_43578/g.42080  ORF Transcript_43578/g.42080 Transcript_43578/m.42080 type:complete len:223 (+) Transcript_43578:1945-2613(+)
MLLGELGVFFPPVVDVAVEDVEHGLDEEVGVGGDGELPVEGGVGDAELGEVGHELLDGLGGFPDEGLQVGAVGGDEGGVAELFGLHEHHPTPADGGWGGLGEVGHLEHHGHGGLELDDLARVQAELLVVVQDGVHVLDPDRIHRPIEDDPLFVGRLRLRAVPDHDGQHPIRPLPRVQVEPPVQLLLLDALRVDVEALRRLEVRVVLYQPERVLKRLDHLRLP